MTDIIPFETPFSFPKALIKGIVKKKYRHQLWMAFLPTEKLDVYRFCYLTNDTKLFYYKNSKAACSTILGLLVKYSTSQEVVDPHKSPEGLIEGRYFLKKIDEANIAPAGVFKFSSVRHPETRLLSAYKNFFIDQNNRAAAKHFPFALSRGFELGVHHEKNLGIYLDYVAESISQNRRHCEGHWREQHINLSMSTMSYDKICKMENLETDLKEVFCAVDAKNFSDQINFSDRKNRSSETEITLSTTQRAKIENLYKTDYEIFGY